MTLVSLEDAKEHLNITRDDYDVELLGFLKAAEAAIASLIGPLEVAETTRRVPPSSGYLLLPLPVDSVTSVTSGSGVVEVVDDLDVDVASGVIGSTYGSSSFSESWYTVVYEAGWGPRADLVQAVKELLRHLWVTQRGGSSRPGSREPEGLSNTIPGALHAMPIRVQQLIEPYTRFGFA